MRQKIGDLRTQIACHDDRRPVGPSDPPAAPGRCPRPRQPEIGASESR